MKLKIIMIVIGILLWFSFIILLIVTSKNEIGSAEIASLITMALLPFFIYLIIKLSNKGKRKNNTYSTPQKPIPPPQNYQYRPQNQSFANIQTQNNLRILQETCNILETTNNLETFFSRFEVGKRIVSDLNNRNYLSDFYKKVNLLKFEVLQKSFKNEEKNISNLKTANAKQKHWESYLALLKKYEEYYMTDYHAEYENIVQTVQATITPSNNDNNVSKIATESKSALIQVSSSQSMQTPISNSEIAMVAPYQRIPKEIIDLLWFSNGPLQNYYGNPDELNFDIDGFNIRFKSSFDNEPSAIDLNLAISDHISSPAPLGYYPSYERLTPQERTDYLNWLTDITAPIDIGYVFIFYYGLERHLFFGKAENALNTMFILRQFHKNGSFLSYSGDAIALYSLIHKRRDILQKISLDQVSYELRLLLDVLIYHSFSAQDIMESHKKFGFDNIRYIKAEPDLFLSVLEDYLIRQYSTPEFPVSLDDVASAKDKFTLALANYSLLPQQRFLELPDVSASPRIHIEINALLVRTHETVKSKLKEQRKGTDNHCLNHNKDELNRQSREASERGYAAHVNSYRNLDFKNISLKGGNPLPLDETEKKFLKALSNQQVDKLNFPVYWTYEYHVNYKEWITKLIENGYVKITPSTEDFSFFTVEQLKSVLRLLHLPTSGKKQELISRISNQAGTENALKELNLYVERFVLTDIGREAVKSIPKPIVKEITYEDLLLEAEEQRKQYENSKVKKYEILGTLDFETCSKCGKMDGKVFDLKDYKPGVTAPPFHDGCRCTTCPYFDDDFGITGERVASDKDGKTYYVPSNMTYSQWRKTIQ